MSTRFFSQRQEVNMRPLFPVETTQHTWDIRRDLQGYDSGALIREDGWAFDATLFERRMEMHLQNEFGLQPQVDHPNEEQRNTAALVILLDADRAIADGRATSAGGFVSPEGEE